MLLAFSESLQQRGALNTEITNHNTRGGTLSEFLMGFSAQLYRPYTQFLTEIRFFLILKICHYFLKKHWTSLHQTIPLVLKHALQARLSNNTLSVFSPGVRFSKDRKNYLRAQCSLSESRFFIKNRVYGKRQT